MDTIKHLLALLITTFGIGSITANAQWTVYDPAVHTQQIIGTAQEIAKFVEMINNQVQQIQQFKEQVEMMNHYVDLFGDPASFVPGAVGGLTIDLTKTELGQTLGAIQTTADAATAMVYSGHELYNSINEGFTTPNGKTVLRREQPYRPIAAIQLTTENYLTVSKDTAERRVVLKNEIAKTTDELKAAQTDAEVQKLTGVLTGLAAALESTDQELHQAASSALVQDIANRADERRQLEARREEQQAEFSEAVDRYGQTFRLMNAPTEFPIN